MFFLITVTFGILLGNTLSSSGHSDPGTIASIDIFLGALLVLLGLRNMFDRKNENQSGILLKYLKIKKAASAFSKFIHYFIVGFLTFLINFSTAIFVLAAARQIGLDNAGSMTKYHCCYYSRYNNFNCNRSTFTVISYFPWNG